MLFHSTLSGNTDVLPFYGELVFAAIVSCLITQQTQTCSSGFSKITHSANGATSSLKVPPRLCTFVFHLVNAGSLHHNQHDM